MYCYCSVHVQSVSDAVDVPHMETYPPLDTAQYRHVLANSPSLKNLRRAKANEQRFSINAHPRLADINLAYRDLVLYRNWTRVALLYTGRRDGDGSGAATFHLQHLLLQQDVDCLTRRLPSKIHVKMNYVLHSFKMHRSSLHESQRLLLYVLDMVH